MVDDIEDPETAALVDECADADGNVDLANLPTLVGMRLATMFPARAAEAGIAVDAEDVADACELGAQIAQALLDEPDEP